MSKNMENKPSYYAIIPADVRYNADIPDGAKLLYGEITALTNAQGYCWASNAYFARLYSCSVDTISRWVKALVDAGYIRTQIDRENGNERRIYLEVAIRKNADTLSAKMPIPYPQKCGDNNSSKNITLNYKSAEAPDQPQKNKNKNSPLQKNSGLGTEISAGPPPPVFSADGWKEPEVAAAAVADWLEYKANEKRFRYRTQKALDVAAQEWKEMAEGNGAALAEMVRISIRNGWSGLFQVKRDEWTQKQKKSAVNDISMEPEEYKREQLF